MAMPRVAGLIRRHWQLAALVSAAAVLRVLVMIGYSPAFWFRGDSGTYIDLASGLYPHPIRALGYPVMLRVLSPTETLVAVVALQHLAGLAIAVASYVFLVRRGLSRWLASFAAVPVLFDSLQLSVEHFILADTLFTTLMVAGILAVLWQRTPTTVACAVAGVLMAGAWLTKPIALAIALVLLGYLALRRVSWRAVVAFALAFTAPFVAVHVWIDGRPSVYGPDANAIFLYGRTAFFADCTRLVLPADQRDLCPTTPVDQRNDRADYYIWAGLTDEQLNSPTAWPALRGFAYNVITQQPLDYIRVVARESAPYFLPFQELGPGHRCLADGWVMPVTVKQTPETAAVCRPELAGGDYRRDAADRAIAPEATVLTRVLHQYSVHVRTPALVISLVILLTLAALATRRGADAALRRDAGVLVLIGVGVLVGQVAINVFDYRLGLPMLPLFCLAGGMAIQSLQRPDAYPAVPAQRTDEAAFPEPTPAIGSLTDGPQ